MRDSPESDLPEHEESLWSVAASPLIWALHFVVVYALAAVWCGKLAAPDGSLTVVRVTFALLTAVALAAVVWLGWRGYRRHRLGGTATASHGADTPEDRHRFLGYVALLLSGLSALAIIYEALVVVMIRSCR
jgi:hypothetical protein